MSEPLPHLSSTSSQDSLAALTEVMEQFSDDWESRQAPPELKQYLPETESINRFLLIELIKIDLEFRWQQFNFPKRIEEYLLEFLSIFQEGLQIFGLILKILPNHHLLNYLVY